MCNALRINRYHFCIVYNICTKKNINLMKIKLKNIFTLSFLFIMGLSFGQAPDLGSTQDFVIFTTVGAVTKTGTGFAHITGHVGSNSGSSTGFGNVNGVMHDGDPASAQASTDLLALYAEVDATIPTLFPGLLLGGGATLTPGVYSSPGASTLDGILTLDGQGDPNAIFIFHIEGAFATTANSKVILINDAQACNVFWKIEGQVDMATGTTMRGTIIANNAAINMAVGDTLEGRALSIAGAISLDAILAYTPIGCGSPVLTGPLAPDLVSAACYTLFTTIGPCTNTGITYVIGDVGSDDGLTTGFNPLFVTGMIHPIPDASTAACGVDVLNAYNYVNAVPHEIELLYPAQFGNNLVLTPHTYIMNGAVTFTDTLYLDAQDDPDAVFLIKIYGALETSTYSKVNLINGTKSENVYWMVSGAVDINDYSIFRGTIICNNGAMSLYSGVYLDGRALTTTGALNTNAITAVMPLGCSSVSAPVIIINPINQIVCTGDSVSFIVEATGTGLTYQWRKGLVPLIDGGNISGATNDTLTINPATILDASSDYNVIVSGTYLPGDTSINVSLTIDSPPIISMQPIDQIGCEGDSVSFSVASSGTSLTYQWRKGFVNLINGGNISGVTSSVLIIDPTGIIDVASNYNVYVTGLCAPGDTSILVSLTLGTAPVITTEPIDQIVCVGDAASFTVVASGSLLTYQWRKGTVDLLDGGNISGATTATLSINPVTVPDAASNYNVVVSGECPIAATSVDVALIQNNPIVTTNPIDQSVCIGDTTTFSVIATGSGLTYQWRNGTNDLVNGGSISGATSTTLLISNTTLADVSTNYYVIVSGSCAPTDTSLSASLVVIDCDTIVLFDFFIPEGFSPNGDGINDLFVITGIIYYPENSIVIFNRWGNKIFETTPYENTFDGYSTSSATIGAAELPVGTYFYVLDLGDGSDVIKGTIYLNR